MFRWVLVLPLAFSGCIVQDWFDHDEPPREQLLATADLSFVAQDSAGGLPGGQVGSTKGINITVPAATSRLDILFDVTFRRPADPPLPTATPEGRANLTVEQPDGRTVSREIEMSEPLTFTFAAPAAGIWQARVTFVGEGTVRVTAQGLVGPAPDGS